MLELGVQLNLPTMYSYLPTSTCTQVLKLGVQLNPGFAERVSVHGNVVYDQPGNYSLRVPLSTGRHRKKLGMTGMAGSRGVLKSDFNAKAPPPACSRAV